MTQPWWLAPAKPLHLNVHTQAQTHQDNLTKPQGSLGQLEHIAVRLAAMQGTLKPSLQQPHMLIFAADHGVAAQGVSAFPQSVTIAMLANFIQGGAAVATLCQAQGIELQVINCGVAGECENFPALQQRPIAAGTADFSLQAAMTPSQAQQALTLGKKCVDEAAAAGCNFLLAGEMGIGNTSAASAMSAALLNLEVAELTGPGTGVQGTALAHKVAVLERSLARARPEIQQPIDALQQLGGFEIGALAGAYVRAAQLGIAIVVDGFITTSAALLATQLNPQVRDWLIFAHQSAEPGHQLLLQALQADPLLHLQMRLGEGSGAATAFAIVKNALTIHNNMATFAEANIENKH